MSNVPTNLIPTRITGLPEYTGTSTLGYIPYILEGNTYKVQFGQLAAVGAVPSSRVVAAGTGLTGGGDLSENRVISIANGGVGYDQLSATGVVAGTYGSGSEVPVVTVDLKGRVTDVSTTPLIITGYVPDSRLISTGAGLLGGGSLASNRTLSVDFSSATPQALGSATAGVSNAAARGDHVHPAVDLSDANQTQGALPLGRGGTGDALSPVAGAVVYSTGTKFALADPGDPGQVLTSAGTGEPYWSTVAGTGTVTSVSVLTANGFAGSVQYATTTPQITINTTVTGLVKGNGSALSAAVAGVDYAMPGANSDITSLSGLTGGVSTPDYIDFDTAATVSRATGRLWWDNADGNQTLSLGMAGSNATLQIGEEMYFRIKASSAITEGQVVMFTGTVGNSGALTGAPATGLTKDTASYVMGVATEDIANNDWGYVTQFGLVRNINTTGGAEAWVDGQILYYNPAVAGGLTKNVPAAPNAKVEVAAVVHAASNGSLFVRPVSRFALGQLNDVETAAASNGDLLQYNGPSGYWQHVVPSTISVGTATNLAGGAANRIAYQTGAGATSFISAPVTPNTFLEWSGSAFQWSSNPLGTVTSVDASGGTTGLSFSGGPITTSGTLTLGGTLGLGNGGTGATTASGARTSLGLGTAAVLNAGVANGVATLDSAGTVPTSQLPAAVLGALNYQGVWNASTNTPTLTSSVGTKGYYYVVDVAGSTDLNGITDWKIGDWAVYNGTVWQKIDNTDGVTSVNGYTGAVSLTYSDVGAPSTTGTGASGTWNISVTGNAANVTGVVGVANGGTGATSLSSGYVLKGNGTSAVSASVIYDNGTDVGIGTTSITPVFGRTVKIYNAGSGGTLEAGGSTVNARLYASEGAAVAGIGTTTNTPFQFITNDTLRATIDTSGRLLVGVSSASPNTPTGSIQYAAGAQLTSGNFGRIWVPGQSIGSATYAGLYGMASTYNAYYSGGWKSIGGGTASAITIDEGIFSFSNSNSVGSADAALTWNTRLTINTSGNVIAAVDYRAPIFYDYDNTAYYLDPASTSNLGQINFGDSTKFIRGGASGQIILGAGSANDAYIQVGGSYYPIWNSGNFTPGNYLPLTGGTISGVLTIQNANDVQLYLNGNGTTFAGISWADLGGTDYMWYYGGTSTFAIGGGGSAVASKKLHVNGGTTIGSGLAATSVAANGLLVETRVDAPIFYDSANTAYYLDPASTGASLLVAGGAYAAGQVRATGWWGSASGSATGLGLEIGQSAGTSYVLSYNRDASTYGPMQFEATSYNFANVGGSYVTVANSVRAPIFYDSDDTGYYVNPASTSYVSGEFQVQQSGISGLRVISETGSQSLWVRAGYDTDGSSTPASSPYNIEFQSSGSSGGSFTFVSGNTKALTITSNYAQGAGSLRAPIFYDSDNTSYYWDFAGGVGSNIYTYITGLAYYQCVFGNNVYSGAVSSPPLQAYSSDGGTAMMSFHRSGAYAVNFGLDPDNYLRIGGWSAAANRWVLDMSGNNWVASSFRAPIFYDSDNTSYYVDPNSTSNLYGLTVAATISGFVSGCTFSEDSVNRDDITTRTDSGFYQSSTGTTAEGWPLNDGGWQHMLSCTHTNDGNYFAMQLGAGFFSQGLFYRSVNNNGSQAWSRLAMYGNNYAGNLYASVYYDSDNTAYYVDPNGDSRLSGNLNLGSYSNIRFGGTSYAAGVATIEGGYDDGLYFYPTGSTNGITFGVVGTYSYATNSFRAPIFYDRANTAYYVDPNGSSVLAGDLVVGSSTNVYGGRLSVTKTSGGLTASFVITSGSDVENVMFQNSYATGTQSGRQCSFYNASGSLVGSINSTGTATSYSTSSDYRLKDIEGPVTNSGAYIDALKPVQGSWKADGSRFIGLLAHEVQEVSQTPIATGEKDGEKMQTMDYSAPELIANLIAEIQSLRARVAQLENQ